MTRGRKVKSHATGFDVSDLTNQAVFVHVRSDGGSWLDVRRWDELSDVGTDESDSTD